MNKASLSAAILAASALLGAGGAHADIIIFDDANGAGWSQSWHATTQTTYVHSGTTALQGDGQYFFTYSAGLVDSANYILEFYINTKTEVAGTGLIVQLDYILADNTVENDIPLDNRNIPVIYVIDGVDVPAGTSVKGFATDADTNTWQKVQVDLSQTSYTGFPYVAHQYVPGSSTLKEILFRGGSNLVIDDVRLIGTGVPEPATLALLGLGGLVMLARRRA